MRLIPFILLSVAASGAGQLLLRSGARTLPPLSLISLAQDRVWLTLFTRWQIIGGLLAWGLATILWIIVLNRTDLSVAYCLGSLNYLIIPLLSHWLFRESLNGLQLIGMGFILIGVSLTIYSRAGG